MRRNRTHDRAPDQPISYLEKLANAERERRIRNGKPNPATTR
ncbi:hypothetical protein HNP84_007485 [Thermocatellispora tengchongensis]|uniref:Uncharacterized protein n=1 Tax=Thermocatellispora tengchongensis TaxID=1073253 RepID=A0A840PIK0_9ACTN|nr:hypothetical protein [Thermocatellispora tengchongensis]MBB5137733.1 hypothetical protein [Thermocatellispora tengchongensis]